MIPVYARDVDAALERADGFPVWGGGGEFFVVLGIPSNKTQAGEKDIGMFPAFLPSLLNGCFLQVRF